MMARLAHLGRRARKARVTQLLAQFDLADASDRRVATYSGGMRRRLDLAVSLLTSPPLVFLDEPTTGLDPRSRAQVWSVVRELADAGTTIFLTTQYLEEADQLANRIAVLNAGHVVATGTPDQLKAGLAGDRVELTFDDATIPAAARSLWSETTSVFDDDRGTLTVPATDPVRTTRELLARADSHGLGISSISILKPTLDDVFLHLTDSRASTDNNNNAEEAAA
jgi:ABC-2 type transport system ATP-binding protein